MPFDFQALLNKSNPDDEPEVELGLPEEADELEALLDAPMQDDVALPVDESLQAALNSLERMRKAVEANAPDYSTHLAAIHRQMAANPEIVHRITLEDHRDIANALKKYGQLSIIQSEGKTKSGVARIAKGTNLATIDPNLL